MPSTKKLLSVIPGDAPDNYEITDKILIIPLSKSTFTKKLLSVIPGDAPDNYETTDKILTIPLSKLTFTIG